MKRFFSIIVLLGPLTYFCISCNPAPEGFPTETALAQPTDTLAPSKTPEPTMTPIPTSTPTKTPIPTATLNATATGYAATHEAIAMTQRAKQTAAALVAEKTQQAEEAAWATLVEAGFITMTKGRLHDVDDFEETWAQRDWYRWWSFGYNLADFVVMTHVDWKSAPSDRTAFGGCDFVIRIKDRDNHLLVLLEVDGSAELGQMTPAGYDFLVYGNPKPGSTEKEGSADFTVVAEGGRISAFVNGERAFRQAVARTAAGDMGYTILSGTNKDYGTYCKFTSTHVWELEK
jgi:hypothetical protein